MRLASIALLIVLVVSPLAYSAPISELRQELLDADSTLQEVEAQLQKAENESKAMREQLGKLDKEISQLSVQLKDIEGESKSVAREATAVSGELAELAEQFVAEEATLSTIQSYFGDTLRRVYLHSELTVWHILANLREIPALVTEKAFLDYASISGKQAYAKAREAWLVAAEERVELSEELARAEGIVANLQDKLEKLTAKRSQSTEQVRVVDQKLAKSGQEITTLNRTLYEEATRVTALQSRLGSALQGTALPESSRSQLGWPLSIKGQLTSDYGWRIHPIFNDRRFHTGVDFAAKSGTPILASADGVVSFSGNMGGYGLTVVIDHGKTISTLYGHSSKLIARAGQRVKKGDKIALVGSTGFSTGPHLHFEVQENGEHVDPWIWLK